jgi:predicted metal-dependent phosphoesterase TrpH
MATVVDLHVHTSKGSSDSSLSPQDMVLEAKRLGLPGLCITEHNAPWDRHEFTHFAHKHDLLLIRGVEVDTDMGHVLVFGLDTYVSGISQISELRRLVNEVNGFMVVAHPFRSLHDLRPNSRPLLYKNGLALPANAEEGARHPVFDLVDAIEVANGSTVDGENGFAWQVAQKLGRKGTGGSDAHSVHGLGRCTTVFEDDIRSEEEFIRALQGGRFHAASGFRAGKLQAFLG